MQQQQAQDRACLVQKVCLDGQVGGNVEGLEVDACGCQSYPSWLAAQGCDTTPQQLYQYLLILILQPPRIEPLSLLVALQ